MKFIRADVATSPSQNVWVDACTPPHPENDSSGEKHETRHHTAKQREVRCTKECCKVGDDDDM